MLIVQIEPPNHGGQGDHAYRTVQPCRALGTLEGVTVVSGSLLSPTTHELARIADVLVLCEVADADLLPTLRYRDARGLLNVFEINDNVLHIQPWNSTAAFYRQPINRSLLLQLASQSHCMQVSTPELQHRFAKAWQPCRVFVNHLWSVPPLQAKSSELCIGWGGSLGHLEDIQWALPALKRVFTRYPDLRLALMGPEVLTGLFSWLEPDRLSFTPSGSLAQYMEFLSKLHIGITPLLPTEFNRCRSDVKFLEYAASGVVSLCSDLEPYRFSVRHGENGLLWSTPDDLYACLCQTIEDEALRAGLREQAHHYARNERLERRRAPERLAFYRAQSAARNPQPRAAPAARAAREIIERHTPLECSPDGRYYCLQPGDVEKMLYNGLLSQEHPGQSLRDFAEASERAPGYYLPHLHAGRCEADPRTAIGRLERALELNPHSCNAAYLLGLRHESSDNTEEAAKSFTRALDIAPDYAPAHEGLGRICEKAGKLAEACDHYRRALAANPFYRSTGTRMAMIALESGATEDARGLLQENLATGEDAWLEHFLLGRIFVQQKRFREAQLHLERARTQTTELAAVLVQLAKAYLGLGDSVRAKQLLAEIRHIHHRPSDTPD